MASTKAKDLRFLTRKRKMYEALMKRARFTFFFGLSLFGASISWLIANVAKLAYGAIPVYEAFVPLALLIVSSVLVITYADIEFLVDAK
jgi:apolipoprotein N-acyltransferase